MSLIETNIKEEIEIFQRDDSFDVMKGVGIILMIWVHCKTAEIGHFAYTFHMPLFFFISGYFFKLRNLKQEMFIDLQRLFVPYLFTCFVMVLLAFSVFDKFSYGSVTQTALLSTLWGGGIFGHLFDVSESLYIGPLWFLLGLFWTRLMACVLFRFVKNDLICGSIIFLGAIVAKCFFEVFGHVPLSLVQAFGCLGFFYMGYLAKKYNFLDPTRMKFLFPICILCWLYCMTYSSLALHKCCYEGFYILDVLGAWGIFCVLFVLVKKVYNENNWFWKIVLFIGRSSIIVLCIHAVDHCMLNSWSKVYSHMRLYVGDAPVTFFRLILAVSAAYLVTKNKFVYEKIFCMKKR